MTSLPPKQQQVSKSTSHRAHACQHGAARARGLETCRRPGGQVDALYACRILPRAAGCASTLLGLAVTDAHSPLKEARRAAAQGALGSCHVSNAASRPACR